MHEMCDSLYWVFTGFTEWCVANAITICWTGETQTCRSFQQVLLRCDWVYRVWQTQSVCQSMTFKFLKSLPLEKKRFQLPQGTNRSDFIPSWPIYANLAPNHIGFVAAKWNELFLLFPKPIPSGAIFGTEISVPRIPSKQVVLEIPPPMGPLPIKS